MGIHIDSADFRYACGQFLTGVTIVTARADDGTPVGLTANSFASVSLDPPLVLVCLDKQLRAYQAFYTSRSFAVHVLAEDQADLAVRFATRGANKFGELRWRAGLEGAPILPDFLALFECCVMQTHHEGDHTIFIGQVRRIEIADSTRLPLGFFRGQYAAVSNSPSLRLPEREPARPHAGGIHHQRHMDTKVVSIE
jgi:flavin reductase (DIM6/NTAB) family NADH-FMN oxidoreductase RutF